MGSCIFDGQEINRFANQIYFQEKNGSPLVDDKLLAARLTICRLLLLEQNPTQIRDILTELDALQYKNIESIVIRKASGSTRAAYVELSTIIDSVREATTGAVQIRDLMNSLHTQFRF